MRATIGGTQVDLTAQSVGRALAGVEPESVRDHFVVAGGKRYPVKQALEAATSIDRSDFTTHQARALFRRLGLELGRTEGRVGEQAPPYGQPSDEVLSEDPFEWLSEADLRKHRGKWIAVAGRVIVASAKTQEGIAASLRRRGMRADSMVRLGGKDQEIPGIGL